MKFRNNSGHHSAAAGRRAGFAFNSVRAISVALACLLLTGVFPAAAQSAEDVAPNTATVTFPDEGCEGMERPFRVRGEGIPARTEQRKRMAVTRGLTKEIFEINVVIEDALPVFADFDLLFCRQPFGWERQSGGIVTIHDGSGFRAVFPEEAAGEYPALRYAKMSTCYLPTSPHNICLTVVLSEEAQAALERASGIAAEVANFEFLIEPGEPLHE
ncbi:hypothetical protein [Algicella marina]|uniref:Uncharacterized protein n=1 Tax=Algicella marina TaxID=2683284 RepID=A0A6P1T447_9RHOB|nr:hypothetical protein [Algicella marina]QHQ36531.1 hypothetical protein GO499_15800 [Algicella marina]